MAKSPARIPQPSEFSAEYEQLLLRADAHLGAGHSDYTVQFTNPKIVHGVQARFRSYVRSLKNSSERPELTAMASNMSTRIASTALVFFRREDSVDAMAIRDALGLSPGFADTNGPGTIAPASGQTTALERLHRLRAGK